MLPCLYFWSFLILQNWTFIVYSTTFTLYPVYCLLGSDEVLNFIGTSEYLKHKEKRFPTIDFEIPIYENDAFLLSSKEVRADFAERYKSTATLYYQGQPAFDELLERIEKYVGEL